MSETANEERHVSVPIASFKVGQQLPFDIYDTDAVMLLCSGSVITPSFLRNMLARRSKDVLILKKDIAKLIPKPAPARTGQAVNIHTEATEKIDAAHFDDLILDGTKLIERFQPRRPVAYNAEMVQNLVQTRDSDVAEFGQQINEIVQGARELPGDRLGQLTAKYIHHMADDLDATVCVAQESRSTDYLVEHSLQTSMLVMALGAELGWPESEVKVVGGAALLNDIGMNRVPAELRDAPKRLGSTDFFEIMKHPIHTVNLLDRVRGIPDRCRVIAYQAHERCDGNGYPRRRPAERIYSLAKALGIVDSYLAMITHRPYRNALLPYHAMEQVLKEAQRGLWDSRITRGFLRLVGLFPVGSFVMLSNESLAKVVRAGGQHFATPHVVVTHNTDGIPQKNDTVIDLAQEDPETGLRVVRAIPPLSLD